MPVMKVDLRVGETLRFSGDGDVSISMKSKSGQLSRLEVTADETVDIQLPKRASVRDVVGEGLTGHAGNAKG